MSKRRPKKAGKRREAPRKPERSYARSVSLRESQIRRLEEAGVTSMSALFQELVDEWLAARDKGELARLREQVRLLIDRNWALNVYKTAKEEYPGEQEKISSQINEMTEKADKIERQIKEDERKKAEARARKERGYY